MIWFYFTCRFSLTITTYSFVRNFVRACAMHIRSAQVELKHTNMYYACMACMIMIDTHKEKMTVNLQHNFKKVQTLNVCFVSTQVFYCKYIHCFRYNKWSFRILLISLIEKISFFVWSLFCRDEKCEKTVKIGNNAIFLKMKKLTYLMK